MIRVLNFVVLTVVIASKTQINDAFLVQNDRLNSSLPYQDRTYQDLLSLIVDERNARQQQQTYEQNTRQQLESIINILATNITILEKEYAKERHSRAYLQTEYTGMKIQFLNLTREYTEMKAQFRNVTSEYAEIKTQFLNVSSEHGHLTYEYQNLTEQYQTLAEQYDKLSLATKTNNKNQNDTGNDLTIFSDRLQNITDTLYEKEAKYRTMIQDLEERIIKETNTTMDSIKTNISNMVKSQGQQIGFSVRNPNKTLNNDGRLIFTSQIENYGHDYNMKSGQFICRIPGLYSFSLTFVKEPGIKEAFCQIEHDGHALAYTVSTSSQSNTDFYQSGTIDTVHHLSTGDKVYVNNCHGIDHIYFASGFSGFLIAADYISLRMAVIYDQFKCIRKHMPVSIT